MDAVGWAHYLVYETHELDFICLTFISGLMDLI